MNLSEAISVFADQLPDIRKACVENIRDIESRYRPFKEMADDDAWTVGNIHQHVNHLKVTEASRGYLQTIKRIDGRRQRFSKDSITEDMIARARERSIKELFTELFNTPIRGGMVCCPFHEDHTASMSLRRHNRYRCFGCEEKGDTIDLYMKANGVNFIQAVKALQ